MSMIATNSQPEPHSSDRSRWAAASLLLLLLALVLVVPRVPSVGASVSSILRLSLVYGVQAFAYTFVPIVSGVVLFHFGFRLRRIAQPTEPLLYYKVHGMLVSIALLGPILCLLPANFLFRSAGLFFLQAPGGAFLIGLVSAVLPAIVGAMLPYLSLWLRPVVTHSDPRREDRHWALVGLALLVTGLLILVPVGFFNAVTGLRSFQFATPVAFTILLIFVALPIVVGAALAHAGARLVDFGGVRGRTQMRITVIVVVCLMVVLLLAFVSYLQLPLGGTVG